MRRLAVLVVPLFALAIAGSVGAGSYLPPPGDCCPQWSPHGTQIVFSANRGQGTQVGVVDLGTKHEHFVPGIPVGVRSPDWTDVAYLENQTLVVSHVDGSAKHAIAGSFGPFAWSPDSKRIAVVTDKGALDVANADGSGSMTIAHGTSPAWSPAGHLIAYTTGGHVHVVRTDGSGDAAVEPGRRTDLSPVWSPDGTQLAYWSSDGKTALLRVVRIGSNGGSVSLKIPGAVTNGAIVWAPDGSTVYGAGTAGLVGIALATGKRHTLVGIWDAVFSPNGRLIAYTAGGECRDRDGVYIADAAATTRRRVSNSCSIWGTSGPDVLHADFSRVVYGLGGDDTLYADDTYYFFDGNTLIGGPGNDRLLGGFARDTLLGGPGNDTLVGGPSKDILNGGPGADRIEGDGGGDTIYARDGVQDVISCGTNGYGKGGRDVVYADRIDAVASDCEIVHRR
jgi:Tol biopolymer transport system component